MDPLDSFLGDGALSSNLFSDDAMLNDPGFVDQLTQFCSDVLLPADLNFGDAGLTNAPEPAWQPSNLEHLKSLPESFFMLAPNLIPDLSAQPFNPFASLGMLGGFGDVTGGLGPQVKMEGAIDPSVAYGGAVDPSSFIAAQAIQLQILQQQQAIKLQQLHTLHLRQRQVMEQQRLREQAEQQQQLQQQQQQQQQQLTTQQGKQKKSALSASSLASSGAQQQQTLRARSTAAAVHQQPIAAPLAQQQPAPPPPAVPSFESFMGGIGGSVDGFGEEDREGKQKSHLVAEQKRRENIADGFASLKGTMPHLKASASRAVILRKAAEFIQLLQQQNAQLRQKAVALGRKPSTADEGSAMDVSGGTTAAEDLVELLEKQLQIRTREPSEKRLNFMYRDEGELVQLGRIGDVDDLFSQYAAGASTLKLSLFVPNPLHAAHATDAPPVPTLASAAAQVQAANHAHLQHQRNVIEQQQLQLAHIQHLRHLQQMALELGQPLPQELLAAPLFAQQHGMSTGHSLAHAFSQHHASAQSASGAADHVPNEDEDHGAVNEVEKAEEKVRVVPDEPPEPLATEVELKKVVGLFNELQRHPGMALGGARFQTLHWQKARVYRFMKACNWSVKDAQKMLEAHFAWLAAYRPECISEADIANELRREKLYWHKTDAAGRPCLVFRVRKHYLAQRDKYETIKFVVYRIQQFVNFLADHPSRRFVFLYDRRGCTRANSDVPMFKKFLEIFLANYPETLHRMYVIEPDFVFKYGWSLCRRFCSPAFREKIIMLGDDWRTELTQCFGANNLEQEFGGCAPNVTSSQ